MPILALTSGLLALVLSVLAIVLATVANRRHMAARRTSADGPTLGAGSPSRVTGDGAGERDDGDARDQALRTLATRIDGLDHVVAELSGAVARLADPGAWADARIDALDAQIAALPSRLTGLEDALAELRDQQLATTVEGQATAEQIDSLSARMQALAEQSALVQGRADEVDRGLRSTQQRIGDHEDVVAAQIQALTSQVAALRDHVLAADPTALRHVAVVRYDAFADVGGRLSYSLAVVDDTDTGFVVTTLAGKSEVRTYVRAISQGASDGSLTAEEQQAIEAARQGAGSRP